MVEHQYLFLVHFNFVDARADGVAYTIFISLVPQGDYKKTLLQLKTVKQ